MGLGQSVMAPDSVPKGLPWTIFSCWRWSQKRVFHSQHNGCPGPLSSSDQEICLPKNIFPAPTPWVSPPRHGFPVSSQRLL